MSFFVAWAKLPA